MQQIKMQNHGFQYFFDRRTVSNCLFSNLRRRLRYFLDLQIRRRRVERLGADGLPLDPRPFIPQLQLLGDDLLRDRLDHLAKLVDLVVEMFDDGVLVVELLFQQRDHLLLELELAVLVLQELLQPLDDLCLAGRHLGLDLPTVQHFGDEVVATHRYIFVGLR
jgi:hypothetical protein